MAVKLNTADLSFILRQIKIAEAHAAGTPLDQIMVDAAGNVVPAGTPGALPALSSPHLPFGLRTVDGTLNNLVAGRETWGAADNAMPRLLSPSFRDDADGDTMNLGPGGTVTNTDYSVIGAPSGTNGGHTGNVADADPRIISNLVVDQTVDNKAAVTAWFNNDAAVAAWEEENPGKVPVEPDDPRAGDGTHVAVTNADLAKLVNIAPDDGISAPFNAWMTFFGQFFDHGLDLINKGGNGTVFIPLQPDDPLITHGPDGIAGTGDEITNPALQFMALTRSTPVAGPGADGVLGTPDDTAHEGNNQTTPFVDQNQTYTSHASHQVFLREYEFDELGRPVSTGRFLDGANGGLATWAEVKAQALTMLGIELTDGDVLNIPLLRTDAYGKFIPDPATGFAQVVVGLGPDGIPNTADDIVVSGTPSSPVNTFTAGGSGAVRIGHAFLDDIAHAANPFNSQTGGLKTADSDGGIGLSNPLPLTNSSFEDDSLASGAPGVIDDPVLGNYAFIDPQGWDVTGFAGLYAPTAAVIDPAGHAGGNVVFLDGGATLVRDTGVLLQSGERYVLTFNVGDRLDQGFGGGTVRLVTTDGDVLATAALPTPSDGQWAGVTLATGAIGAANAGEELRIEILHGGSGQVLIDNVQLGTGTANSYDDELLDRHFITGDGRGNENIGLTTVHHVFHSEHNRQVDAQKAEILASGDLDFINEWLLTDVASVPSSPAGLDWDGERLFQSARFSTEMQYQHLVFEEFGRKIHPNIEPFVFNAVTDINPAIFAEFANTVYRFGHSMLTDSMPRIFADGSSDDVGLITAFLNPVLFDNDGALSADEAAAAIVRGMTVERGNAIDEFVVGSLRNNLVGLPLDLPALNIARGRDTGIPTLNDARAELYGQTQSSWLKPYASWVELAANLKNPMTVVNLIAAYGQHTTITSAATLDDKRLAAEALVFGGTGAPADRLDFLNSRNGWTAGTSGLNDIDLWVGGLAERIMPFGGMLGSTFTAIFEAQLEALQFGDRFYYLSRTQGQNFLNELENNSFAKLILANTSLSQPGADGIRGTDDDIVDRHIGADAFGRYDYVLEVNQANQAYADPTGNDPVLEALGLGKVVRDDPNNPGSNTNYLQFNGGEHVVLGGTAGNDTLISSDGDDALWGNDGDDRIESGFGVDQVLGGAGNDIITDAGDEGDFLKGEDGDDVMATSSGLDVLMGGRGKDVIFLGADASETFGGQGDDFLMGSTGSDFLLGNEGDDWMEGGNGFDTTAGDNSELFFNSGVVGHDVMFAGSDEHDFDAESGDDIMVQGESVMRNEGMFGFDWVTFKGANIDAYADMRIKIFTTAQQDILRNRFDKVEAASGWNNDDTLIGDNRVAGGIGPVGIPPAEGVFDNDGLDQAGIDRIAGLDQIVSVATGQTFWEEGNILLGGGGSDTIQGGGGNDIIDGDRWLNVRISIRDSGGAEIATVDTLKHVFDNSAQNVALGWAGKSLFELLIDRTITPGQMHIVREILTAGSPTDLDVAAYDDVRANYTFTQNLDGSVTVTHTGFGTDPLITVDDGTDTLRNIEVLRFADQTIQITPAAATGAPVVSDLTPTEGQTLTLDLSSIADPNGLGTFQFQWQQSADGFTWVNIPGAGGPTFTPQNLPGTAFGAQAGMMLRAQVSFTDGLGNVETVTSAATGPVGVAWNGANGVNNTLNGTAGDDIGIGGNVAGGVGGNDLMNGNDGNDQLQGLAGNDTINGGNGLDTISGGAGNDVLDGGADNDTMSAEAGNDTMSGGTGNDTMNGGVGNDRVDGGAGDDRIVWNFTGATAGGRDFIDGGLDIDTVQIDGNATAETFRVYTRAAALAAGMTGLNANTEIVITRNGTNNASIIAELDNVEELAINTFAVSTPGGAGGGTVGADTIQVIGNFTGTSLNFNTITINGTPGDDTIDISGLSSPHRIVLKTQGGNDVIIGTVRPQDVIELPQGTTPADFAAAPGANGMTVLTGPGATITFYAPNGMPHLGLYGADHGDTYPEDGHVTGGQPHQGAGDVHREEDGEPQPAAGAGSGTATGSGTGSEAQSGGGASADPIFGTDGRDGLVGRAGDDVIFARGGDDDAVGGRGDDMVFGDAGDDRLLGEAGDDYLHGGKGDDIAFGGAGDDMFVASVDDGSDTYYGGGLHGDAGVDTLDMSAITAAIEADLGGGHMGRGWVSSSQSGRDVIWGVENILTGAGDDTITASGKANIMDGGAGNDTFRFRSAEDADGDTIVGFQPGDKIDLSQIDANGSGAGNGTFTLVSGAFTGTGQLMVSFESREDGDYTIVQGNTTGSDASEFKIKIKGVHDLTAEDFNM